MGILIANSVFNILIVVCIDVLRQNLRSTFSSDPSLHNYSELVPGLLENSTIFDMFITVALLYTWISITCFFNPFQNSGDSLGLKGLKELKSPPHTAANWQTPLCKVVFWSMLACFVFFDRCLSNMVLLCRSIGSVVCMFICLFACFWASFACFFVLQAIFCLLSPQSTVCMVFIFCLHACVEPFCFFSFFQIFVFPTLFLSCFPQAFFACVFWFWCASDFASVVCMFFDFCLQFFRGSVCISFERVVLIFDMFLLFFI